MAKKWNMKDVLDVSASAWDSETVSPSDSVDLVKGLTRGLYIGGGGDTETISVEMGSGVTQSYTGFQTGQFCPLQITRVNNTGTTMTLMVALY